MNRLRFLALASSALLLQACMFSPGMHMDPDNMLGGDAEENSMVELVDITPKLIAQNESVDKRLSIATELTEFKPENYLIGPNDVLFITVWDHPELTAPGGSQQTNAANARVVRDDGTLFYPFIGNVRVAGLSLEELRDIITNKLSRYIESPQVDVNVMEYHSKKITVSGAFTSPGSITVNAEPMTLTQAVGIAGIDQDRADLSSLVLTRNGKSYTLDYDQLTRNPSDISKVYMRAGDHLHLTLNDNRKVFVMGEVRSPRTIPYSTSSITLSEVLATAGGPLQETSSGREVYVIRGVENLENQKATVFQLNARSPSAFVLADQFEMQPQDVVFVGAAGITRWNRFVSQLFPSANIFRTSLSIEDDLRDRNN